MLYAPDMHWESWTVSSIPAEPEEAWSVTSRALGSHAAWDQSSLTVEPVERNPESRKQEAPRGWL